MVTGRPSGDRFKMLLAESVDTSLSLRLHRDGEVNGHLIAVEVRVEGATHERVQADRLALDQLRLKRLNTEAVQRWCAVEQHRVLLNNLFQNVPHFGALTINQALRGLDVLSDLQINEALLYERLEQLECHDLGQTTLVQLERWPNNDNRTARVVHALAQKVLAEAALLALEHVREGLERPVSGALNGTATAAVEQCVHGFLKHALLVVHHDLGGAKIKHALQAVVAVDDAAVQIVEIRSGEAATVQLHHGAQIRSDHRQGVQHHGLGLGARVQEGVNHLDALEGACLALCRAGLNNLDQVIVFGLQIKVLEALLDSFGALAAEK